MLINTIEITLVASKKAGILSNLMRELGSFGLVYRRCNTIEQDDGYQLNVLCEGELESTESALIKSIEKISNVDSVNSVIQSNSLLKDADNTVNDTVSVNEYTELHPLRANDAITQDVMHIVEDRLAEIFGPSKGILLRTAAKKSKSVGDLFLNLAKELDDDQRKTFFRNVEGIDSMILANE